MGLVLAGQDEKGAKGLEKVGNTFTVIAIMLGLSSLAAFCLGGWKAFWAFLP